MKYFDIDSNRGRKRELKKCPYTNYTYLSPKPIVFYEKGLLQYFIDKLNETISKKQF